MYGIKTIALTGLIQVKSVQLIGSRSKIMLGFEVGFSVNSVYVYTIVVRKCLSPDYAFNNSNAMYLQETLYLVVFVSKIPRFSSENKEIIQ